MIIWSAVSLKGGRENNEDNVLALTFRVCRRKDVTSDELVCNQIGLFAVADGVGGLEAGEVSSYIFIETLEHGFSNILKALRSGDIVSTLISLFKEANKNIIDHLAAQHKQGGTTATTALLVDDILYITHIGDSRAYLITPDEGILMLTEDHSVAWNDFYRGVGRKKWNEVLNKLKNMGEEKVSDKFSKIREEIASFYFERKKFLWNHSYAHVITRVLGYYGDIEPDVKITRMPSDCILLMTTDGLTDLIYEDEIYEIARKIFWSKKLSSKRLSLKLKLDYFVESLISEAERRKPHDNISIIVVSIKED